MSIIFKPVRENLLKEILSLEILPSQKKYIESIEQCLAEAQCENFWKPTGIFDNEILIGFAMYGNYPHEDIPLGRLWLDRFLIDKKYQGKGYGCKAFQKLLGLLFKTYPHNTIYLSVIPENISAINLYLKLGFKFNGKKDINGENIMVKHRSVYDKY